MDMEKIFEKIENKFLFGKNNAVKLAINLWYPVKFKLLQGSFGTNSDSRERPIVISLTSFPQRIDQVHFTLKSLLLQHCKPDKIVLYLGRDEFEGRTLPKSITDLFQYGVEVRFRDDLKPHTKYFYAMQEFRDSLVITVDDDILYRPKLVGDLFSAHERFQDCVICTRAHYMRVLDGHLLPYNDWDFETGYFNHPSYALFATGVGGVLYDPRLFIDETFNEDAIKELSLRQDDVWLKFMELRSGIRTLAIPATKTKYLVGIWGGEKINLNSINVHKNANDIYIRNVMSRYQIDLRVIADEASDCSID